MGASHIVRILFIILIINTSQIANSQIWLTGKVYDSTRMVTIPAVKVMTKKGEITFTDSIGRYGINVGKDDSVSFTYRGKSTNYFPVKQINYTRWIRCFLTNCGARQVPNPQGSSSGRKIVPTRLTRK